MSMTPSGIETATCRFVPQCLIQLRHRLILLEKRERNGWNIQHERAMKHVRNIGLKISNVRDHLKDPGVDGRIIVK
jgi:hypothetical protein